jgi:hypothetical protein
LPLHLRHIPAVSSLQVKCIFTPPFFTRDLLLPIGGDQTPMYFGRQ